MSLAALSRMVKFEHSLFALPFAASAAVLVLPEAALDARRLLLVAVAVVAARTAAMAMNRIADRAFDARNPRTRRRELVTGEVSPGAAWALLLGSSAALVAAAALISPLCGALSLPVLAILLGYSYAKRFTWAVHLWLGVAQALGPIGVALALTGRVPAAAVVLGLGVGAWVAGFDVLYSLQDMDFDRGERLRSIPARFGVQGALLWARLLHLAAALGIAGAGLVAGRGPGWLVGSVLMMAVLGAEHAYAAPGGKLRPERIGAAFFTFNAFASVAFAACALADVALRVAPR
ncbi:UbiA-like polyprenyltransferase [Anaeromyxobacter diazotrophicus]|uniref:4-hydroxybenzoate octaprenyltransferase n=1 Tax=Anaeromyxobacter diazotrophicus TaxID=2590199 RepID=A0A7I9VQ38_9BACT|nr:UbiA-like polyprenyltransferase [Anaeromyxobacter diazotrophicus]GEJ58505.1 4-hydroxybenzoate octaprenyltransferase [Anaeromyxobacter diazotrophicus]